MGDEMFYDISKGQKRFYQPLSVVVASSPI
jgi:hypothetical protein